MGIQRNDAELGSYGFEAPFMGMLIVKPAQDVDRFATTGDPHLLAVGDDLLEVANGGVGGPYLLPRCGFQWTYTDNADANFVGTIRVTGVSPRGEIIEEDINLGNGTLTRASGLAYVELLSAVITQWDLPDAADLCELGTNPALNTTVTRTRLALPPGVVNADELVGIITIIPPAEMGIIKAPQQINLNRRTFTIDDTAAPTAGKAYLPILRRDTPTL